MKCITGHETPSKGDILHPPHIKSFRLCYEPVIIESITLLENLRFGSAFELGHPRRVRRVFKSISAFPDDHWLVKQLDRDIEENAVTHQSLEDILLKGCSYKSMSERSQKPWYLRISDVEKKLVHMARAFVYSPQILVLHKPFDDLEVVWVQRIMDLVRNYVHRSHADKKRRTVFLSCGTKHMREQIAHTADYLWDLTSTFNTTRRYRDGPRDLLDDHHNVNSPRGQDQDFREMTPVLSQQEELQRYQEWQSWKNDSNGGSERSCGPCEQASRLCFNSRKVAPDFLPD